METCDESVTVTVKNDLKVELVVIGKKKKSTIQVVFNYVIERGRSCVSKRAPQILPPKTQWMSTAWYEAINSTADMFI